MKGKNNDAKIAQLKNQSKDFSKTINFSQKE